MAAHLAATRFRLYGARNTVSGMAEQVAAERFERHRQPWTHDELQKLQILAKKGMGLKSIAKALTRSEQLVKDRAKQDGLKIAKLR